MIDLQLHTNYSDGIDSVEELLKKCEHFSLQVIAITDHDNIEAHLELLENPELRNLFSGEIINAAEFKTYYDNISIELLAFGFDIEKVKYFPYLRGRGPEKQRKVLVYLKEKGRELGLKFDESIDVDSDKNLWAAGVFEREVIKYKENIPILEANDYYIHESFYRKCLSNPGSIFYYDDVADFPTIDQIIEDVHEAGGLVFLAHPFAYAFEDKLDAIESIVTKYNIDGIECYHSEHVNEIDILLALAKKHNKYISGGSDHHGKPDRELGKLAIPISIMDPWIGKTHQKKGNATKN